MGLLCLIPGLILWLADLDLFAAEETVGKILTAVGGGLIALQILWVVVIGVFAKKQLDRF
jgi:hypothetical protein